jgi:hypothetical protein
MLKRPSTGVRTACDGVGVVAAHVLRHRARPARGPRSARARRCQAPRQTWPSRADSCETRTAAIPRRPRLPDAPEQGRHHHGCLPVRSPPDAALWGHWGRGSSRPSGVAGPGAMSSAWPTAWYPRWSPRLRRGRSRLRPDAVARPLQGAPEQAARRGPTRSDGPGRAVRGRPLLGRERRGRRPVANRHGIRLSTIAEGVA